MKQRLQGVFIGLIIAVMAFGSMTILATNATRNIQVTYGVNVVLDGSPQNFPSGMEPFVSEGRTFLPLRSLADTLGLDVEWDGATSTVYLTSPGTTAVQTPPATTTGATGGAVTLANFNRIQNGMSRSEVNGILGSAGETQASSEFMGTTMEVVTWSGANFAVVSITFTNGSVTAMVQVGL